MGRQFDARWRLAGRQARSDPIAALAYADLAARWTATHRLPPPVARLLARAGLDSLAHWDDHTTAWEIDSVLRPHALPRDADDLAPVGSYLERRLRASERPDSERRLEPPSPTK